MNQRPFLMQTANMVRATERSKNYVNSVLELAAQMTNDPDKATRIEAHLCKACFYASRMGGAAMTMRTCGCCGSEELYGSTDTDAFCKPCATKNDLCKHCGGDIEMRVRRKNWPNSDKVLQPSDQTK